MQATMNVNGLQRGGSQDSYIVDNSLRKKCSLWYRRSLREKFERPQQNTGSLSRVRKPKQSHSTSLVDYTDPQRTKIVLEKQDNETFGFEIQTYGLQLRDSSAVEMCTFVCKVHEDSAAESAGLTAGDVIISINSISTEGLSHEQLLDLIRESTNSLKMETVSGTIMKKIELEKKMNLLKQTLREKLMELQALTLQENRLMRGNMSCSSLQLSLDCSSMVSSPTGRYGRRFSSDSSFRSVMTDDSDQISVFGDLSSPSPCSAASIAEDGCFFSRDFSFRDSSTHHRHQALSRSSSSQNSSTHHRHQALSRSSSSQDSSTYLNHQALSRSSSSQDSSTYLNHQTLSRSSSSSFASSSSSLSPSWEETRISSLFGTLPRKSRKASVRKHIFKLLPGLQRSVEEDETNTQ